MHWTNVLEVGSCWRRVVPWFGQLDSVLSALSVGFNPRPGRKGFFAEKAALRHVFLRVLLFPPFILFPSVLQDLAHITDAIQS